MFKNFLFHLSRVYFDVIALLSILAIIYVTPETYISFSEGTKISPKIGILALFFSKFLFTSAGILHAHITREVLFPYINFRNEDGLTSNAVLVIALYVIIIFGWTHGG